MKTTPSEIEISTEAKRKEAAEVSEKLERVKSDLSEGQKRLAGVLSDITTAEDKAKRDSAAQQAILDDLVAQRDALLLEIEQLSARKADLSKYISSLEEEISKLTTQKSELADDVRGLNVQKAGLQNEVSEKEADIEQLSTQLTGLVADIKVAIDGKKKADADYAASAKRLIQISDREQAIDQREAYIQDKYEKAGLEYTPTK